MNLSLALNMDRQTIVDYQARIESDPDTVTTVVKTKTAAEIKKLQVHGRELGKKYGPFYGPIYGQAIFESKRSIFAEGGASTSIVTENDDKLLVLYYYMFSLHDEGKWETIAFYMGKFDGHQCHDRMRTLLLQQNSYGRIRNPTTLLQQQLQEQEPPVTCRSFRYIRSWNLQLKHTKRQQSARYGLIRNPTVLQQQLLEQEPPVTCRSVRKRKRTNRYETE